MQLTKLEPTQDEVSKEEFEVQKILQRGNVKGLIHYLVKWKNYSENDATWEPIQNLEHCKKAIAQFEVLIQNLKSEKSRQIQIQKTYSQSQVKRKQKQKQHFIDDFFKITAQRKTGQSNTFTYKIEEKLQPQILKQIQAQPYTCSQIKKVYPILDSKIMKQKQNIQQKQKKLQQQQQQLQMSYQQNQKKEQKTQIIKEDPIKKQNFSVKQTVKSNQNQNFKRQIPSFPFHDQEDEEEDTLKKLQIPSKKVKLENSLQSNNKICKFQIYYRWIDQPERQNSSARRKSHECNINEFASEIRKNLELPPKSLQELKIKGNRKKYLTSLQALMEMTESECLDREDLCETCKFQLFKISSQNHCKGWENVLRNHETNVYKQKIVLQQVYDYYVQIFKLFEILSMEINIFPCSEQKQKQKVN